MLGRWHAAQERILTLTLTLNPNPNPNPDPDPIQHFAGDVTYGTEGWLNKNKDPLNGDLMVLMQFSANTVLKVRLRLRLRLRLRVRVS